MDDILTRFMVFSYRFQEGYRKLLKEIFKQVREIECRFWSYKDSLAIPENDISRQNEITITDTANNHNLPSIDVVC